MIKIPTNLDKHKLRTMSGKVPLNTFDFNELDKIEKCFKHKLIWNFSKPPYRLYRRGKNRCKECGVKLL